MTRAYSEQDARYNARTAAELASDAEAAVLGILHLAEAYDVPLPPAMIFRTLSGLARAFEHVPEAVVRLRATAIRHHELGSLDVASGPFTGDSAAAIDALQDAVDALQTSVGAVQTSLDRAQAALAGVRDAF